jgi:hypothetical protein
MSDLCGHLFGGARRAVVLVRVGLGLQGGGAGGLRLPPFLPRRAICNLENLEGENKAALGPQRRLVGALGANLGLFSVGWGRAGRVFERP